MRVYKNLMGDGSKIHVDEIATKIGSSPKTLSNTIITAEGGNSNGNYIRFGNGIQICWIESLNLTYNNGYSLSARWNFPSNFISGSSGENRPTVIISKNEYMGANVIRGSTAGGVTNSSGSYASVFVMYESSSGMKPSWSVNVKALCIGRWK